MFGNNELYAPRIEWEVLRTVVEDIRTYATDYENSFNIIRKSMETKQKFEQVCSSSSSSSSSFYYFYSLSPFGE